ncbi:hypothetical protein HDU96_006410 [Phlyctochytrium bullatum]|nr:hypothetical protein HDU96_006410 [Phlyctochytrium bullatum]
MGVGLLLLTSETFLWLLYLRFTALVPIRRRFLRYAVLTWMCIESAAMATIWVVWMIGAEKRGAGALRFYAGRAYNIGSVVQAATALVLSGYFVVSFYIPRLKGLKSKALFTALFTSGLVYLVLETGLQLGFTVFYSIDDAREFASGLNQVCTSLRHSIFLIFLLVLQNAASGSAERDRERRWLARKAGEAEGGQGFYAKAAAAKGVEPSPASASAAAGFLKGVVPMSGSASTDILLSSRATTPVAGAGGVSRRGSWSSAVTDDEDVRRGPVVGPASPYGTLAGRPGGGSGSGGNTVRPSSFLTDGGMDDDAFPAPVVTTGRGGVAASPHPHTARPGGGGGGGMDAVSARVLMVHGGRPSTDSARSAGSAGARGGQYPPMPAAAVTGYNYKPPVSAGVTASSASSAGSSALSSQGSTGHHHGGGGRRTPGLSSASSGASARHQQRGGGGVPGPLPFQPPEVGGSGADEMGPGPWTGRTRDPTVKMDLPYTKTSVW